MGELRKSKDYHIYEHAKAAAADKKLTFALAGNQNCGKTTLFNQLTGATLAIDTNYRLPDGSANPYFGLPFIADGNGQDTFYQPQTDDNYRAMLAYNADFTTKSNWMKWQIKQLS